MDTGIRTVKPCTPSRATNASRDSSGIPVTMPRPPSSQSPAVPICKVHSTWDATEKAGEIFKPPRTALAILQTAATGGDGVPQKVTSRPIPADVRCGPTFANYRDQGIRPVLDQANPPLRNKNTDATMEKLLAFERK